jgi:hypothetical protein
MREGFGRLVAACSGAVASPWAVGVALAYVVASLAAAVLTGGEERTQLWWNLVRNEVTILLLVLLHARDERRPAVPPELSRRLDGLEAALGRIERKSGKSAPLPTVDTSGQWQEGD